MILARVYVGKAPSELKCLWCCPLALEFSPKTLNHQDPNPRDQVLKGSWDLVTRVIIRVTLLIATY